MGMKKHGSKKDAIEVESSQKETQRVTWKSKYEQICALHVTNGTEEVDVKDEEEVSKPSALAGLSGYLSSDSSSGESELQDEIGDFLKDVDEIYEKDKKKQALLNSVNNQTDHLGNVTFGPTASDMTMQYEQSVVAPTAWQECCDSSTGFTYYWNVETNEVTWDMPPEYREALKQWQQYQAQGVAALLQARVQQQIQQQQQQLLLQQSQEQQAATKVATTKARTKKHKKNKSLEKHSDSEDEKIELITSYGPFSEDESSDTDQLLSKTPKPKKKKTDPKSTSPRHQTMGPQLPPHRIIRRIDKHRFDKPKANKSKVDKSKNEKTKSEVAKVENNKLIANSLVPYHPELDDSDTEEPLEHSKLNSVIDNGPPGVELEKIVSPALSPAKEKIAKTETEVKEDDENILLDKLKSQTKVLKELGGEIPDEIKIIITENNEKDDTKTIDSNTLLEESKNLKLKLLAKGNQSGVNSISPKKRTADHIVAQDFLKSTKRSKEGEAEVSKSSSDVSGEKKKLWLGMPMSLLNNDNSNSTELKPREEGSRGGFGFIPSTDGKKRLKTEKMIAFVKADVLHLSEEEKVSDSTEVVNDEFHEEHMDIKDVSGVLCDKMKFLSEGKEPVTTVQLWTIQLETLLAAWESKCLKRNFLEDWLTKTSKELESLELSVAPDGWVCEWQRI